MTAGNKLNIALMGTRGIPANYGGFETFAEQLLLEARVAVVPGSSFGEAGRGHVRACYATSLPDIDRALERIQRFVASRVGAK